MTKETLTPKPDLIDGLIVIGALTVVFYLLWQDFIHGFLAGCAFLMGWMVAGRFMVKYVRMNYEGRDDQ